MIHSLETPWSTGTAWPPPCYVTAINDLVIEYLQWSSLVKWNSIDVSHLCTPYTLICSFRDDDYSKCAIVIFTAPQTRGQISINNAQSTRWSLHVQLSAVQNNIQTHLTQNFNLLDIFCVVRKCCGCRHWWRNVIIKKLKSWTEEPAPRWILLSMN